MFNFEIEFSQPWLLLLLIPAFALGLFPYFRVAKKYRRNRNRVTSTVLHLIVMTLAVFVLSGMSFSYDVYNSENEILFVVDASFSTREEEQAKTDYMRDVVAMSDSKVYSIGIVTFGYNQEYAVPLTNDLDSIFVKYENANKPDTSATDIAAALSYARGLFENPESGKIVLISDGVETDARASAVVRSIAAEGIRIDTVCCSTLVSESEALIVDTEFPEYNLEDGDEFDIKLTVKSTGTVAEPKKAVVSFYDNGEKAGDLEVSLTAATQDVTVSHKISGKGLHSMRFEIECDGDDITENNAVYSYLYLETFDQVLIIESSAAQSDHIKGVIEDMDVTVLNAEDGIFPTTLAELCEYDEIILNNIANKDMPDDFVKLLNEYVYRVGGGLFTVGGGEPDDPETAHAYNRKDMGGTLYQQMLPVQAIDYTPPLGLAIIIDVSGSMGSVGAENSKVTAAKNAARSIVRDETCLTERDYCCVLTLSDKYTEEIKPIPMTRQDEILDAIYNIGGGGGTVFSPSIERASMDLLSVKREGLIEKMHVVLITDGAVTGNDIGYINMVEKYHKESDISFSFIAVEPSGNSMQQLEEAAAKGGGRAINAKVSDLTLQLKDDIRVPEIKEVEYGDFVPTIDPDSYYASVISQENMPTLKGFYGTKVRDSAELVLKGNYNVPIYAQWKYGAGTVGSFMCDLNSVWSDDFLADESGREFVKSVITHIFPTENIRPKDIEVRMNEGNYTTQLSLYPSSDLKDGETIRVSVNNLSDENAPAASVVAPSAGDGYSRGSFITLDAGVYGVIVERLGSNGEVLSRQTVYKAFSYSREYSFAADAEAGREYMMLLAQNGNGAASDLETAQPWDVFKNFVTSFHRVYDPTLVLVIIVIVLFLLDIAVRKFKFKWLHEIVREHRAKKAEEKGGKRS